jgi:hypothetical protein
MAGATSPWGVSKTAYDIGHSTNPLTRTRSKSKKAVDAAMYNDGHEQPAIYTTGAHEAVVDLTRKPSERAMIRGRQNSLRRVKDSTDMLRERSLHRRRSKRDMKEITSESTAGGREGRQFTVANVGNNGMIYLR